MTPVFAMATKGEERKGLRKKKRVGPTSEGEEDEPFFDFKSKKERKNNEEEEECDEVQEISKTQVLSPSVQPAPSDEEEEEEEEEGPALRPAMRGEEEKGDRKGKKEKFIRKFDCGERLYLGNNHFVSYQEEQWEGYRFNKICIERAYVSKEGHMRYMVTGCPTTYWTQLLGQLLVLMRRMDPESLRDWLLKEKTTYVDTFLINNDLNVINLFLFSDASLSSANCRPSRMSPSFNGDNWSWLEEIVRLPVVPSDSDISIINNIMDERLGDEQGLTCLCPMKKYQ